MSATSNVVPWPVAARPIPIRRKATRKDHARQSYRAKLLSDAKKAAASSADPIFAAIAAHLAAVVAKQDHSDRTCGMSFEEERREEALSTELWDRCDEQLNVVLSTPPTTLEGVAALLEHVALHEFLDPESKLADDKQSGHETFLSSFNECHGKWKRFGQQFPLHLAEAIRNLMIRTAPPAA